MADSTSPSTSSVPIVPREVTPAPRRRRVSLVDVLLIVGIIVTISLFVWAERQRRVAHSNLSQTATQLEELRQSAGTSGQAVADEVLGKLRRHLDVPTDPEPTVATIVGAEGLKEYGEFYQSADNGDYLIITQKRAILYDPDRDIILDVVPVTIDPDSGGVDENQEEANEGSSPSPSSSSSPTPRP